MEKRLPVWKNAILNIAGSLTYAVCQWLMTILVVSLGSVEEAGVLSLVLTALALYCHGKSIRGMFDGTTSRTDVLGALKKKLFKK